MWGLVASIVPYAFQYYKGSGCQKTDIMDPLSTLIRICLIKYFPSGTKLMFGDNTLSFHSPSMSQGIYRKFNGDSCDDVNLLYLPIQVACQYYLNPRTLDHIFSSNSEIKEALIHIFERSIYGLEKLSKTYKEKEYAGIHINQIIGMIKNELVSLEQRSFHDPQTYMDMHAKRHEILMTEQYVLKMKIYKQFDSLWTEKRILMIHDLLQELEYTHDEKKHHHLIKSIDSFLCVIDEDVKRYVDDFRL